MMDADLYICPTKLKMAQACGVTKFYLPDPQLSTVMKPWGCERARPAWLGSSSSPSQCLMSDAQARNISAETQLIKSPNN